jgi:putative membrane protein
LLTALFFPGPALGQVDNGYYYGGFGPGMMGWMWGGGGIFMMIFVVIFWILIIIGIVYLVKWLAETSNSNEKKSENKAVEILQERYVNGEIDKKEFEEKMKDISR